MDLIDDAASGAASSHGSTGSVNTAHLPRGSVGGPVERAPHARRAQDEDARTAEGQRPSEGDENLDGWIGLDIRSTSNPLLRTSASGPFAAVSTFQIARLGIFFSIFQHHRCDDRFYIFPLPHVAFHCGRRRTTLRRTRGGAQLVARQCRTHPHASASLWVWLALWEIEVLAKTGKFSKLPVFGCISTDFCKQTLVVFLAACFEINIYFSTQ